MLTPAAAPVDGAPRAVMWSISQIAERDGVSKQAVSKRVQRLVASGLTVERDRQGRISAVNVAQFDHLSGQYRDPSKDQRPDPDAGKPKPDESFDEAARQRAWLAAERERIALAEKKGELVIAGGVAENLIAAGVDIARIVDRLVNATDDFANAVAREGVHGLRVALKRKASAMRTEIADALAKVALDAPEVEPAAEEIEAER